MKIEIQKARSFFTLRRKKRVTAWTEFGGKERRRDD